MSSKRQEYDLTTREGLNAFYQDNMRSVADERSELHFDMHDNPQRVTIEKVKRYSYLNKLVWELFRVINETGKRFR